MWKNYSFLSKRARLKAKAAAAAATPNDALNSTGGENRAAEEKEIKTSSSAAKETDNVYGVVKEDYLKQPFKNPDNALKEALHLLAQEEW
jgi:hypothetical protein